MIRTSATSTTPSVVLARGPDARVSVSIARVTIGEFTVRRAAKRSATKKSGAASKPDRKGIHWRTIRVVAKRAASTADV
jgi:hypothetical protein